MKFTIFIDFDGVIVDSINFFADAVNVSGRSLNQTVNFAAEDLRNIKHMSIPEITSVAGVEERLTREFILGIDDELFRRALEIPIFPGMARAIRQLSRFGPLAVISASSSPVISKVLQNHEVFHCFADIIGGDAIGSKASKMRSLIHKYGGSSKRTCMIGDTVSDIEQSRLARVNSIAVSWGWHRMDRLRAAAPDFEVHRPADLVELIDRLRMTGPSPEPTRCKFETISDR